MGGLILVDSSRLVALIVFRDITRNGFGQGAVYLVGLIALHVGGLIAAYGSRLIFFVVFHDIARNDFGPIAAYLRGLVGFVVFRDVARNTFGQIAAYRVGLIAAYGIGLIARHGGGLVAAYVSRQIFADRIGHVLGRRIRDILRLIVDIPVFGSQVDIRCGLFHRRFLCAVCDDMRRFCGRVDFAVGISGSI